MPAFNRHFNDREVAELANFMLEHFGAQPGALSAGRFRAALKPVAPPRGAG